MKHQLIRHVIIGLALLTLLTACASTKTLHVWKDEQYNQRLRKVLIIAVTEQEFMREHFENVLAESLQSRGIEAVPSNKVLPQSSAKIDREAVVAKVRELGIENVLVSRSVGKKEVSQLTPGGLYFVPTDYYGGWYSFYSDSLFVVSVGSSAYDAEYFNIVNNVYDVRNDKLIWSYLSRVKVENSKQGAINPFIDVLMKQMKESGLL
ncbi:MAG TPA: hypothetical protein VEP69_04950 [Thermodesulfovibrionales bacterium]|nr:hypothetical protein [Thermodesulfovibrionales bacterium]